MADKFTRTLFPLLLPRNYGGKSTTFIKRTNTHPVEKRIYLIFFFLENSYAANVKNLWSARAAPAKQERFIITMEILILSTGLKI